MSTLGTDSKSNSESNFWALLQVQANALGIMQIYCACKDTCHVFLLETGEARGEVKPDV